MPVTLDAIDIKILDLMQRDASLSTAELAERVGLSQSPCWRRIQRLREEGYIKAVVAIVDPQKLGFHMQIFAQVKMTTLTEEERYAKRLASSMAEMQELYDAGMARLEDIMVYVDARFPLKGMPEDAKALVHLGQSIVMVSFPVEVWKQPRVLDSGASYIQLIKEPVV